MRKYIMNTSDIILCTCLSVCACGLVYYIWKKIQPPPIKLKEEKVNDILKYEDVIGYLKIQHLVKEKQIAVIGFPEDRYLARYVTPPVIPMGRAALIVGIINVKENKFDQERSKIIISKGFDQKLTEVMGDNTIIRFAD